MEICKNIMYNIYWIFMEGSQRAIKMGLLSKIFGTYSEKQIKKIILDDSDKKVIVFKNRKQINKYIKEAK